jgi:competence protein ComEC
MSDAVATVRAHPRHLVLGGAVAGLLLSPLSPRLALAAVLALALGGAAGRVPVAFLAAAAVLGGGWLADARLTALDHSHLGPLVGRDLRFEATLLEQPRLGRPPDPGIPARAPAGRAPLRSRRALVELRTGPGAGERVVLRASGRAAWPRASTGSILAVSGRLARLQPYDEWQRRRGAHGTLRGTSVRPTGRRRGGVAGAVDRIRERAERALSAGLSPPEAALQRGMVLGQDDALSDAARGDFQRSGLAHLLAASGQNVMLLAILALAIGAAVGAGLRWRLGAALALVALYVPLAGAGPSIQRAGVMGGAGLVAAWAGRPASRWYAVGLAAFATLALNPRAAGDPGWQLSFAAVVAILALARPIAGAIEGRRVPGPLAEAAALTIAATLGTAPLIAFHFDRVSLASLPANVLAAPAVAPLMWLGMVSAALGQVSLTPPLLLNALSAYLLGYIAWLAHASARLPGASIPVRLGSPLALALAYASLGAATALAWAGPARLRTAAARLARARVASPRPRPRVRRLALALTVLAGTGGALALGGPDERAPPPAGLRIAFLDIGQGDAALVQRDGASVLIDTGRPDARVLDRLREAGVARLDALVITHQSADHDGGAAAVLDALPVGLLVDNGDGATRERKALLAAARAHGVRRVVPTAGQALRVGRARLAVLWPDRSRPLWPGDPNERALVLLLEDGLFDALLTADAESDVTNQLEIPPVDLLKVAHHGSADPGLGRLLARIRPQAAVISVGLNSYGHPTPQTTSALAAAVPRVYRTDRDGTVRVDVAGGRMTVTPEAGG